MPEISFYILPTQTLAERLLFVCKLLEKAFRLQQYAYVYTDSSQQAEQLDSELWTFRASSFVPHQMIGALLPTVQQMILIGTQPAPTGWQTLLFNLSVELPRDLTATKRIIEVIDNDTTRKQQGRIRFRHYQQQGFPIKTYHLD